MTLVEGVLAAQAIASGIMCGVIWFVQLVHYPLFVRVPADDVAAHALENQRRTGWVVIPPMLVEGLTAAIVAVRPPAGVGLAPAIAGLAMVLALWLSTAIVQMPLHARLARDEQCPDAVAALVRTNWFRTSLWTARACLAAWMLRAAG
jgi:hypothetical protein